MPAELYGKCLDQKIEIGFPKKSLHPRLFFFHSSCKFESIETPNGRSPGER